MCVARAFDTLDYLNENPTAAEILAARYLKQENRRKKRKAPKSTQAALGDLQSMSGLLGSGMTAANKLPPHLRQMALEAIEIQAKLSKSVTIH